MIDPCVDNGTCTEFTEPYTWVVAVALIMMVFTAWGVGANDCSNSFASSVGARALTMRQAVGLAFILEFLGALLAGAAVTGTIRKGITSVDKFTDRPELLMYGMMLVDMCTGIWLLLATFFELPVSTTHSCVGSIVGMSVAIIGIDGVVWIKTDTAKNFSSSLTGIIVSWVISPVLAGIATSFLFLLTRNFVLRRSNSYDLVQYVFPFYAFIALWIATFAIIYSGLPAADAEINALPGGGKEGGGAWVSAIVAFAAAVVAGTYGNWHIRKSVAAELAMEAEKVAYKERTIGNFPEELNGEIVQRVRIVNFRKKKVAAMQAAIDNEDSEDVKKEGKEPESPEDIEKKFPDRLPSFLGGSRVPVVVQKNPMYRQLSYGLNYDMHACVEEDVDVANTHENCEEFDYKTELYFRHLQVFVSCFNMFAHGSNDVANSIAPFAGTYLIWRSGSVSKSAPTPQWILAVGGISMSIGLATYGYKVMRTMGTKMTKLSNSRGLCIELASSCVVLVASAYGIPVSTTQIATGGIMAVGMIEGRGGVNWKLMGKVFFGWIMTIVFTALTCGFLVCFTLYGPEKMGTERRISMAKTLNADAKAFATLLNASTTNSKVIAGANTQRLQKWGASILKNETSKFSPPYWVLDPYEATLKYTCQRAFIELGLMPDDGK